MSAKMIPALDKCSHLAPNEEHILATGTLCINYRMKKDNTLSSYTVYQLPSKRYDWLRLFGYHVKLYFILISVGHGYNVTTIKSDEVPLILVWERPRGNRHYGPADNVHCGCNYTYDQSEVRKSNAVVVHCSEADVNRLPPDFPKRCSAAIRCLRWSARLSRYICMLAVHGCTGVVIYPQWIWIVLCQQEIFNRSQTIWTYSTVYFLL